MSVAGADELEVLRAPTAADSIEMQRISEPDADWNGAFAFSNSGSHFLYVSVRGNLATGTNDFALNIYEAEAIEGFLAGLAQRPVPKTLVSVSTASNLPGIFDAKWSADGTSITFLGLIEGSRPQLYSVDIESAELTSLVNAPAGVWSYDVTENTVIYTTRVIVPDPSIGNKRSHGFEVADESLLALAAVNQLPSLDMRARYATMVRNRLDGTETPIAEPPVLLNAASLGVWLSHEGDKAVAIRPARSPRLDWNEYPHPRPSRRIALRASSEGVVHPADGIFQYVLIDIAEGEISPLLDAPTGQFVDVATRANAIWSEGDGSLVLVNTMLPAATSDAVCGRHACVAELELDSGHVTPILKLPSMWESPEFSRVTEVTAVPGPVFDFEAMSADVNGPLPLARWSRPDGVWNTVDPGLDISTPVGRDWSVFVCEDLNEPPEICIRDNRDGQTQQLSDLNPAFAEMRFQQARILEWTDPTGRSWKGGLLFPDGYSKDQRYPLVVQTHGFFPRKHFLDGSHALAGGPFTTGQAAQALAANGIMVLQVEDQFDERYSTLEAAQHMAGIEAAIDKLDSMELIDPENVGLSGFSRSGYYVANMLAHSERSYRAALLADPVDRGYVSYMLSWNALSDVQRREYETMNGGVLLEESGLSSWVDALPTFNVNAVDTPVRLEAIGPASLVSQWEYYSAMKMAGKSITLSYIPNGTHILVKPLERQTSQQGAVDWFTCHLLVNLAQASADQTSENHPTSCGAG